jgi:thymidylate synthase (FAD)
MATQITPKVFLIARPELLEGLAQYLAYIGAPDWETDPVSGAEIVAEAMGRLCYKSWKPDMNPNVKKIREGSAEYLQNIIKQKHGSVLEHNAYTFILADVSRVVTHELVRHRVGIGYSQESLRYVRLSRGLRYMMPACINENPFARILFQETMDMLESVQQQLSDIFEIDSMTDFKKKKELTSAFRRVAPIGLATHIGMTANARTLRHIIEQRTSRHAEREIRDVFAQVGALMMREVPALFSDYQLELVDGLPEFTTSHPKV